MQKIRVLALSAVVGGVALLSGCVAVPGDPVYGGGYGGGYSQPYYDNPVYVDPAPAYISGGVYYEGGRPYYNGRPYYGRPGYPAARPGYYPGRPGYPGVRPGRPGPGVGVGAVPGPARGPQLSPGGVPSRGLSSLPVVPGTGGIRGTTNGPRDQ